MTLFWYGVVPVLGAFYIRHSWRAFRGRFDNLRLSPLLDYAVYRALDHQGGSYRFLGGAESIPDGRTLWVRSSSLTIPVFLEGAYTYVLPMTEYKNPLDPFDPGREAPERIRWDRLSTLTEGAKVYVGGKLSQVEGRWTFVSTKADPLLVIFYDGPDRSLTARTIRAGRDRNEYWNPVTPYSLILGTFSLIIFALSFVSRPAFRPAVITALLFMFTPLLGYLPPGMLLVSLYRRFWWRARVFRAYRDMVRLPSKYLPPGENEVRLPDGERYGWVYYKELPSGIREARIPIMPPEGRPEKGSGWFFFGILPEGEEWREQENPPWPAEPKDPLASYGLVPGRPEHTARLYALKAHALELFSCLLFLAGISVNYLFIMMIIYLLS
ncbi:hypothetical protein LJC14_00090 [Treponema sp. OttesenSCG-928-L16]|nr:hypothetical protein [Treponema sp. OttesenSCG-928-L16]